MPANDFRPDQPAIGRLGWPDQVTFVVATIIVLLLRWHTLDEPLDCDEAAYGYVAHRLLHGDRIYADVFENKPPLAYAPYAVAITIGGYGERAIRLLPVPFVVITVWIVQLCAQRLGGSVAAAVAASLYAVASSDPFTFGNGANLEIYMNACLITSLYCVVRAADGVHNVRWALSAGLAAGCATAIKQVAVLFVPAYVIWLWCVPKPRSSEPRGRPWSSIAALAGGVVVPWVICISFAAAQGVLVEFWEAVFVYGPTLASEAAAKLRLDFIQTDVVRIAQQHPELGRMLAERPWLSSLWLFLSGNPHATAWWGTGIWPLMAMSAGSAIYLLVTERRLAALLLCHVSAACLAIYWPGLFWQHYYMLLLPSAVFLTALGAGRLVSDVDRGVQTRSRASSMLAVTALAAAALLVAQLCFVQWQQYVRLTPEEITTRHKGGGQWVALRQLATWLRLLPGTGPDTRLFIWGVQSPLHVYSQMDSVTPYFFTDPLMQQYDVEQHPLVEPHKTRILSDLEAKTPLFVFVGQRPFASLQQFVERYYVAASPPAMQQLSGNRGLYVRRDVMQRSNAF